jgi:hypothetical protein
VKQLSKTLREEWLPLHARVVFLSLTTVTDRSACSPLYANIRLSMPHPSSNTDFAIRVFTSAVLLTSPTTMQSYLSTILRLNLCKASARHGALVASRQSTLVLPLDAAKHAVPARLQIGAIQLVPRGHRTS